MFRFGANYRVVSTMDPRVAAEEAQRDCTLSGPAIELLRSFLANQPLPWTAKGHYAYWGADA